MPEAQFTNTQEYQIKLLAYMLANHDFCSIAADALEHEHFSDKALQWYFDALSKADPRLTPVTLKEELIKSARKRVISEDEIDKYLDYFGFIKRKPLPAEEEYINQELSRFIKQQAVKRALTDAWDLAKEGEWDLIVDSMSTAVTKGVDILDTGYFYFETTKQRLTDRLNRTYSAKLSTGIPDLDDILYGGIRTKQLGLICGGTGRGKSIFLEWLARVAVLSGQKVVYYTLELSDIDVADRFDALFSQIKINELKTYNNELFTALSPMSAKYADHLVIKEYPADTATVSTLKAHLRQLAGVGFLPDLVIVDYLDLLKPHRNYTSQHAELDAITKALHGFSKEMDVRVWTATQLNRSGMVMETPDETAVAGAVAKLYTADIALFLAATKEEMQDQEMRVVVAKNRNGPAPRTIKIDTDYARMTFYKPMPEVSAAGTTDSSGEDNSQEEYGQEDSAEDNYVSEVDGAEEEDGVLILQ